MKRPIWSTLAAQLAEQISLAAIPLVAVLAFGAGAGETGVLQTAQTLPFLLLALPAGLLADRLSRTRLMVSGEALRTVSLLCIAALIFYGGGNVPPRGARRKYGGVPRLPPRPGAPARGPGDCPTPP